MPAAALAAIGAAGSIATAAGSAAVAANRKKFAEYKPADMGNYQFADAAAPGQNFYELGKSAQDRQVDPYAEQHQRELVGQLEMAAKGQGPSAAQAQLQAGRDQAIKTSMALAGSARGPNIGAAQVGASTAATQATQGAANQAAQLRAQEQQAAMSQLGGVLGGMRQQTLGEAERRDQLERFYMQMGASREEAQLRAKMAYEEETGRRQQAYQTLAAQEEQGKVEGIQKGLAGVGQGFSQLGSYGSSMGGGGAPKGK